MKNLDIKQLTTIVRNVLSGAQRYTSFIFIISILLIYAFLIVRISVLSQASPSEDAIAEQSNTIKRLKLDETSIVKIEQLEGQNVEVKSIFEKARDNPFQD
jgi:hypothetical protein